MAALVRTFSLEQINRAVQRLNAANLGRAVPYTHALLGSRYGTNQKNWYVDTSGSQYEFTGSDAELRAAVPGIFMSC
jgi:hypothetical protein